MSGKKFTNARSLLSIGLLSPDSTVQEFQFAPKFILFDDLLYQFLKHTVSLKSEKWSFAYLLSSRILSWSALPRWRVGKTDGNVLAHRCMKLETNYFCQISWTHSLSTPQTEIGLELGLRYSKKFGIRFILLLHTFLELVLRNL